MGHLPFWQEYVAEMNTTNYENLFEKSDTAFPVGPYQLYLEAIGETPKDW